MKKILSLCLVTFLILGMLLTFAACTPLTIPDGSDTSTDVGGGSTNTDTGNGGSGTENGGGGTESGGGGSDTNDTNSDTGSGENQDLCKFGHTDEDGNDYRIHASNGDEALARKLRELPAGTELELLLHPEEDYVLGIYEDGTPILGWQAAQQEIEDEDLGFSWLGIAMWVLGIVMFATEKFSKKKK